MDEHDAIGPRLNRDRPVIVTQELLDRIAALERRIAMLERTVASLVPPPGP